jgi:hypothetical protein
VGPDAPGGDPSGGCRVKRVMTAAQFARWKVLSAAQRTRGAVLSRAEWDEVNMLQDHFVLPVQRPEPGTPATYRIGSDRYAMKVVRVARNGQEVWAAWEGGEERPFTYRRKTGQYVAKGAECGHLHIGHAEDYRDPSF